MDDLYQQIILDHYKHPHNWGKLSGHGVISSAETNSSCGDKIEASVMLSGQKIVDIKFTGEGCAISIAATSLLTDYLRHKKISDLNKISLSNIESMLGIGPNPAREKCLTIGLHTIKTTINQ